MTRPSRRSGEFDLIAQVFAPLARGEPGALGLKDDAAFVHPAAGRDLVVTTDAIVAGVHFLADDPPDTIAAKALHVNLSDLAAKGATPRAYLLTAILPAEIGDEWLQRFASALRKSQKRYGISLIGGDTVSTPGPLALNIVALGEVPSGKMLTRAGAKAGDDVWVTGTIGDAALGLRVLEGASIGDAFDAAVVGRFRVPQPRLAVGQGLIGLATASVDISDGLISDLGHIVETSRVAIRVDASSVPLSNAAKAAIVTGSCSVSDLLTGGDDYELAFSAPPSAAKRIAALAAKSKTRITKIGEVRKGKGVSAIDADGRPLPISRPGYTHF